VSLHFSIKTATLVDDNSNFGMTGHDVHLLKTEERFSNVNGMDSAHQLSNFPIAALVQNHHCFAIVIIISQMAYHGKGVLFSLVVIWKLTRSRWIIVDPFMLVGNRGLRQE